MQTICIAGKNEIAVNALRYLAQNFQDCNLIVVPNKTDNGRNDWQPSLIYTASQLNVPVFTLSEVSNLEDVVFFSLEFDSLIKPRQFKSKALFNIHFSALPKYKGMFTSVFPLLHGETSSGVTLHIIDAGIDTGEIIDQIIFPLEHTTTCRDLYQLYLLHGFALFKKNLNDILENKFSSATQSGVGSSYFSKKSIDFSSLKIDLNKTAFEIHNQFRAFTFREFQLPEFRQWPIYLTEITNQPSSQKPGIIVHEDDSLFILSTIDYNIILYKDYYEIFWNACKDGNDEKVVSTLPHIPDINLRNKKGWNALILAVYNNHINIAKILLEKNADINSTNFRGTTTCMYALSCFKNTADNGMLELILSFSPNLEARDDAEQTIFDYIES